MLNIPSKFFKATGKPYAAYPLHKWLVTLAAYTYPPALLYLSFACRKALWIHKTRYEAVDSADHLQACLYLQRHNGDLFLVERWAENHLFP